MDQDVVEEGPIAVIKEKEGELLQIDIAHILKEIQDLKRKNEDNNKTIEALTLKVQSLEVSMGKVLNKEQNDTTENMEIVENITDEAREFSKDSCWTCEKRGFQTNENWRLMKHIKVAHENG